MLHFIQFWIVLTILAASPFPLHVDTSALAQFADRDTNVFNAIVPGQSLSKSNIPVNKQNMERFLTHVQDIFKVNCAIGYTKNANGSCVPVCAVPCGLHAHCAAPNVCACEIGYQLLYNSTQLCMPVCAKGCAKRAHCEAPNVCACNAGYKFVGKICLSKCLETEEWNNTSEACEKRCESGFIWVKKSRMCAALLPAYAALVADEEDMLLPAVGSTADKVTELQQKSHRNSNSSFINLNADLLSNSTDPNQFNAIGMLETFKIPVFLIGLFVATVLCVVVAILKYLRKTDETLNFPIVNSNVERYGDYELDRSLIMVY